MNTEQIIQRFDLLTDFFPEKIKTPLLMIDAKLKISIQEIRLRAGLPLAVTIGGSQYFVKQNGKTSMLCLGDFTEVTSKQLEQCYISLCNHSVYSHNNELCNGYIMLSGGHRAGVCGTFTENGGIIKSVRDISSLNIRIAKEIIGCSNVALKAYDGESILICGGPGSGKTTLLRDIIRRLANGSFDKSFKVSVVDSRGEIAAVSHGIPTADLGKTYDVITNCPKEKGIEMALRTQFPDIIAFDELGSIEEVSKITESLNSGVSVITTAHVGRINDISRRKQIISLIENSAVDKIIFCSKSGFDYKTYKLSEISERLKSVAVL